MSNIFQFLVKISFNYLPKVYSIFVTFLSDFCQIMIVILATFFCRFFRKFDFFTKNLIFYQKFDFFTKDLIFFQKFDFFYQKFDYFHFFYFLDCLVLMKSRFLKKRKFNQKTSKFWTIKTFLLNKLLFYFFFLLDYNFEQESILWEALDRSQM